MDAILLPSAAGNQQAKLLTLIDWLIPEIEQRLSEFLRDPDGFRS
jgi:hypothetical protein